MSYMNRILHWMLCNNNKMYINMLKSHYNVKIMIMFHAFESDNSHCRIKKTPIGEVQRFSAPNCQLFQKFFKNLVRK